MNGITHRQGRSSVNRAVQSDWRIILRAADSDDDAETSLPVVTCSGVDPLPTAPVFGTLINQAAVTQVNQYGLLGFVRVGQWVTPLAELNWTICPTWDYANGPAIEGVTQLNVYATRWRLQYNSGMQKLLYSRVGDPFAPVSVLLFPLPLILAPTDQVSISFDANARACFAFDAGGGSIQLRRFVGGVPTTFTWVGTGPRLFFDGILQPNTSTTDLVCFYQNGGNVCARFQRDNFSIEYVLNTPTNPLTRITKTDTQTSTQILYFIDSLGVELALQSAPYPAYPVTQFDLSSLQNFPHGGSYLLATIIVPPQSDLASLGALPGMGVYLPVVVPGGSSSDNATLAASPSSGTYINTVITPTAAVDTGSITLAPHGGTYPLIIVPGGTYSDNASILASPHGGSYV